MLTNILKFWTYFITIELFSCQNKNYLNRPSPEVVLIHTTEDSNEKDLAVGKNDHSCRSVFLSGFSRCQAWDFQPFSNPFGASRSEWVRRVELFTRDTCRSRALRTCRAQQPPRWRAWRWRTCPRSPFWKYRNVMTMERLAVWFALREICFRCESCGLQLYVVLDWRRKWYDESGTTWQKISELRK